MGPRDKNNAAKSAPRSVNTKHRKATKPRVFYNTHTNFKKPQTMKKDHSKDRIEDHLAMVGRANGAEKSQKGNSIQGRHISAYVLMEEAFNNRMHGKEHDELPQSVKDFMLEYIISEKTTRVEDKEITERVKNFDKYLQEIDNFTQKYGPSAEEKDIRMQIYNTDISTSNFIEDDDVINLMNSETTSQKVKELFGEMQKAYKARHDTGIDAMYIRNMIKNAQGSDSTFIQSLFATTMGFLNKGKGVAKPFPQPKKQKGESSEGPIVKNAINILRNLKDGEELDHIAQNIANLFDYNFNLIKQEMSERVKDKEVLRSKWKEIMFSEFYGAIGRHIKFSYDGFHVVKKLLDSEETREKLMQGIIEEISKKEGWRGAFRNHEFYNDFIRHNLIKFESNCTIDDKIKLDIDDMIIQSVANKFEKLSASDSGKQSVAEQETTREQEKKSQRKDSQKPASKRARSAESETQPPTKKAKREEPKVEAIKIPSTNIKTKTFSPLQDSKVQASKQQ